jgi:hypothetical protein
MAAKNINPGFELAITTINQKLGDYRGAIGWLAKELGVSRQSVNYWKVSGFPAAVVPKVSKLIGVPERDLDSRAIVLRIPELAWTVICNTSPKSATNQAVDITRRK